ncbi:MAG TPA: hypothetical protein VHA53_02735, partial [Nitrolancea sp.]|nr:hypothetical protein [Nitrolancea sp.]
AEAAFQPSQKLASKDRIGLTVIRGSYHTFIVHASSQRQNSVPECGHRDRCMSSVAGVETVNAVGETLSPMP